MDQQPSHSPRKFLDKERCTLDDLREIVAILRGEGGCPWDQEQTHASIRRDFLEETYEALEAIDADDPAMLREELGDVLLQVAFHCQIEEEAGRFEFLDVTDEICRKLIVRHPHVFGETGVSGVEEVLSNWDQIKKETKGQQSASDTLRSVPKVFPALMRAQKLSKRASRAGVSGPKDPLAELVQTAGEFSRAAHSEKNTARDREMALGRVLFACVRAAQEQGLDAEEALGKACDAFLRAFEDAEAEQRLEGQNTLTLGIEELDRYWPGSQQK